MSNPSTNAQTATTPETKQQDTANVPKNSSAPAPSSQPKAAQQQTPETKQQDTANVPVPRPAQKPQETEPRTVRIALEHPIMVNGRVFPAGESVEVPARQAKDLQRIDATNRQYESNLVRKHDRTRKVSDVRT